MNSVNEINFNETMAGYVWFALDYFRDALTNPEYEKEYVKFTEDQLYELERLLLNGLRMAKSEMTMEMARNYRRKR